MTIDIERLYDTHGVFIGRTIERFTGSGAHVDDLLQETFLTAFRKSDRFDPKRGEAVSWLYGIAANLCRKYKRSRFRAFRFKRNYSLYAELEETVKQPEQTMMRREDMQIVRKAVERLPFGQREVFVLYELEGMEGKDIGALLNLKEGTVWRRLHYARKAFDKYLLKKDFKA